MKFIDAPTLRGWITDGQELALLDAREEGEFGASHLFWAVPCSLSKREIRARALLPRLAVRTCVVDDGRGVAEELAKWLESIGASNVHVLKGGTKAWAEAGYILFSGVNVPSKAFGEWVEHHYGTESVDAPDLKQWIKSGRDMIVLDSRTREEFNRMSIPTGISVPGGELVYRIGDMVPNPDTLVVVNCAGRTRSIMGAESLRRAGIPNKVVALRNGTMGWELAGLTCDRGKTAAFTPGTPKTAVQALERAKAFAEESGVGVIGPLDLERFEQDSDRTLYLLDVRDPPEFRAGHLTGSRAAPGGQLVQATDTWIGVRNARIVLVDDTGVRARMSAAWLRQMGHRDVFVLEGAPLTSKTPEVEVPELGASVDTIDVAALQALLDAKDGTVVLDLNRSIDFRDGHVPGAIWGVRTRLKPGDLRGKRVVITSPDAVMARLAVPEVKGLGATRVQVLQGGTQAWAAAGKAMEKNRLIPADDECIDFYLRAYDRNSGIEEAMKAYLSWEIDLVHEIERDGTVAFGVPEQRPTQQLEASARAIGAAVLNALLPPRCLLCDAEVESQGNLCPACFASAVFVTDPLCARCGVPFLSAAQAGPDALCVACHEHAPAFRRARAALCYDDFARRVILPFKHADRTEMAGLLVPMMLRAGAPLLARAEVLVPVPLHRRRLFARRYNQAAILAQTIGGRAGKPALLDALQRTRQTASLDHSSAAERAAELAGAIVVRARRRPAVVGRSVLLIDDVMTSCATASACAEALLGAGAVAVDVLVAARVPDPRLR